MSAVAALVLAGSAAGSTFPGFKTPSRNIGCGYLAASAGFKASLRCDIRSGLVPEPTRKCDLDWTGLTIGPTGRARAVCAGDTAYDPSFRVLAYGKTWRRGGIRCFSRRTGVTCTNPRGHGFFLSRKSWKLF